MNSGEAILRAEGLDCGWGRKRVLSSVSLSLEPGQITALIGKNGAGKSTLLNTLAGLAPPLAGRVFSGGDDISSLAAPERARRVGLVPQREAIAFDYTIEQVVLMGRIAWSRGMQETPEDRAAADQAIREMGLHELRHQPITCVSGGQAQLAAIARALAQQPSALLLDEPTAHLDYEHHELLAKRLKAYARGRAILFAAHDITWAMTVADRVICLKDGAVLWQGAKEESLPSIEQALSAKLQMITGPSGGQTLLPWA